MLDSVPLGLLAGLVLSAALVGSALLGWLEDLKRVGASTSARETSRRARKKPATSRPMGSTSAPPPRPARSSGAEQEDRIREAYFAKERKAREVRERERRQKQARQKSRPASGARSTHAPPVSPGGKEAHYRATLELTGTVTKASLRIAYRRLIAAYHPDRCATLGDKLKRLAEEETKRINEAYSYFQRQLK